MDTKRLGESDQGRYGWLPNAAFESGNVCAINVSAQREFLLADTGVGPMAS